MKTKAIIVALAACSAFACAATPLDSLLLRSGYIHTPIPPDTSLSLEACAQAKPVLERLDLLSAPCGGKWNAYGEGSVVDCDGMPALGVSLDTGSRRARGPQSDPDYAVYGHAVASLALPSVDLSGYNRLELDIEPRCPGLRVVTLNLSFRNATGAEGKGYNVPTGAHLIVLDNNRTNRCILEIGDFRRDAVSEISLSYTLNGRDMPAADSILFRIAGVEAQRVADLEKLSGWSPAEGHIVYSMSGYAAQGSKTAIVSTQTLRPGTPFRVVSEADGTVAYEGKVAKKKTTTGTYGVLDFSSLHTPGRYRIETGPLATMGFDIAGNGLWDSSCWKVLNFIYGQRCGYAVPRVHSHCHIDLMSEHGGQKRMYAGGWHDAGDLSQQTLQSADVTFALLELYERKKQSSPALASRLLEEALWGLDFVLRNRFGDGYHASSVGLLIWQDGVHGTHDDISSVRVQNIAFDNYLYAAYEAYASRVLADIDPMLAMYLARIAEEDYRFAEDRFAKDGFGGWINPYEHTYCTSESLHMAAASWAASLLYGLTGNESYAAAARERADYVLRCQQTESLGANAPTGFFYRNPSKRSVVHFIHQSREQIFMQALAALCATQPEHADFERWHGAIVLYGGYIKSLMQYTAPYGMIPAGIYRDDEPDDEEAFFAVHLFPPDDARERFGVQAAGGVKVASGYFVRRFPVWFNIFNGNLAVHMAMGKAAAVCAACTGDAELLDIAREQLYWTVGKNPFAQSLIYGEGHRYPELNNFSSGRLTGAMPVGIRSLGDTDEPYWPQINNACYKEVWLTSAGKWLSLLAETDGVVNPENNLLSDNTQK